MINQEEFQNTINSWLGVRYIKGGRDINGVDCGFFCLAFVNDYWKRINSEKKIIVPESLLINYDPHFFFRDSSFRRSLMSNVCDFIKSSNLIEERFTWTPEIGDLLLFPLGNCPAAHMAIMVSNTKIIHATFRSGVSLTHIKDPHLRGHQKIFKINY